MESVTFDELQGSSPHMRGARRLVGLTLVLMGIIPAYAGSTSRKHGEGLSARDHPRICGEHCSASAGSATFSGSSPHMRGARVEGHRLIGDPGSSPRMRGAPCLTISPSCWSGIIPAYAGSTYRHRHKRLPARDQPRVCGEHFQQMHGVVSAAGSSPRMRGALCYGTITYLRYGIIPAYAGSTFMGSVTHLSRRDHPRVCGEHAVPAAVPLITQGSSPRMRGAQVHRALRRHVAGIIPAYAGSTCARRCGFRAPGDHPRVCGEHSVASFRWSRAAGSSPRMRGALDKGLAVGGLVGIIPAYAGSTRE